MPKEATKSTPETTPPPTKQAPINEEYIRTRAYQFYEARGREDGHDWEDWFRAESEITTAHEHVITSHEATTSREAA